MTNEVSFMANKEYLSGWMKETARVKHCNRKHPTPEESINNKPSGKLNERSQHRMNESVA